MTKTPAVLLSLLALSGQALLAADAKAGQAAYEKSCKGCHGATGSPNPAVAKMLNATIPELSSDAVQSQSDEDLKKVIAEGKGKMKPIKTLNGSPDDVVAFLHTLKK
jgi:mono/diheme cytochrome c family protein